MPQILSDFEVSWQNLTYEVVDSEKSARRLWPKWAAGLTTRLRERIHFGAVRSCSYSLKELPASRIDLNASTTTTAPTMPTTKTILKQLNGSFKSSQMTAIMGPSGAGKTSLMNFLSRQVDRKQFTGTLTANGCARKLQISYIPQHDRLAEFLTVRENLTFAAHMKRPRDTNHQESVLRVSSLLGLSECLDTRTKLISGGEQKRLTFAQELLSAPDILLLDEPTSGLDSTACLNTLRILRDLVGASRARLIDPMAVVLTIHQPPPEAMELFDKLYVMAQGGSQIVYDGPPSECGKFLVAYSGLQEANLHQDPVSFLIEIASGERGPAPVDALAERVHQNDHRLMALEERRLNPKQCSPIAKFLYSQSPINRFTAVPQQLNLDPCLVRGDFKHNRFSVYETQALTGRCLRSLVRDPVPLVARIMYHLMLPYALAFIVGYEPGQANACPKLPQVSYTLEDLIDPKKTIDVATHNELLLAEENLSLLFSTLFSCIAASTAAMVLIFDFDMKYALKELHNNWYSPSSYVVARILANIPMDLLLPTLTMSLLYTATSQNTGQSELSDMYRILMTIVAAILGSCTGQLSGLIFGALYMGQVTTALFTSQGFLLPLVLLSGFIARIRNMSLLIRAISWVSLFRHTLEIMVIARYGFNVCQCDSQTMLRRAKELGNDGVKVVGVRESLRTFTDYWLLQQEEQTNESVASDERNTRDVFDTIAQQITLYNTHGFAIESCKQFRPYQMNMLQLDESSLPVSFLTLATLLSLTLTAASLIVKYVIVNKKFI